MKHPLLVVWITTLALLVSAAVPPAGHAAGLFGSKKKAAKNKDDDDTGELDEYNARAKVPLIGEHTQVAGGWWIQLEGAGLVVDLNGTGEDPPPSEARHVVLEDLKRRGIPNPNKILKMPNVTVVIVTGYVPALIRKNEHFDVEVRLPDGSKVKSLNGGRLMPCYLREHLHDTRGVDHTSHEFAVAQGPILVGSTHKNTSDQAGMLRRGRIVAGGTWKWEDRELELYLRNEFRSERNAVRIANAIGRRFFDYDRHGQRIPLAEAKTDQKIVLKVLPKYRDNYPRYVDVVRKIAFRETDVARAVRIRAQMGSARTGNVGPGGAQARSNWRSGNSDSQERAEEQGSASSILFGRGTRLSRRFRGAGCALRGSPRPIRVPHLRAGGDGLPRRSGGARQVARIDERAECRDPLRRISRLTTLDKNDPFVRGEMLGNQFRLHTLKCEGSPMVHITNCKKAEVVLYGAEQEIKTPIFARAGNNIIVSVCWVPTASPYAASRWARRTSARRSRLVCKT